MKSICVYCGAASGISADYALAARELARVLVQHQLTLVYGGGNIGLMGIIADEMLRLGGEVIGVIPQSLLDLEVGHLTLTRLHVVQTMHERKAMMSALSDGFIAMPGGMGTLEELFEMLTWLQLDFHQKPVGVLNVAGYYDGLLGFLDHSVHQGFLQAAHRTLLLASDNAENLVSQLLMSQGN